jgi:hypothetical protein
MYRGGFDVTMPRLVEWIKRTMTAPTLNPHDIVHDAIQRVGAAGYKATTPRVAMLDAASTYVKLPRLIWPRLSPPDHHSAMPVYFVPSSSIPTSG